MYRKEDLGEGNILPSVHAECGSGDDSESGELHVDDVYTRNMNYVYVLER
jgi:hypothetical protein